MQSDVSLKALLWIVAAGFFMQALDATIVNTALPAMAASLHERALDMQPVVVAYSLVMAILTPASGWLADRFGTRKVYFSAILVFVAGSLLCALSHTLGQLVLARVVQGAGGSMLMPIGRLAVLRTFPARQYLAALAVVSVSGQVGPLIGPVLGGWMVQAASWHWIFLINLPIGLAGCAAVLMFLPKTPPMAHTPRFDLPGFALLAVCMAAFSMALGDTPQDNALAWMAGLGALSVLAAWAYIWHARRRRQPLFELSLFSSRTFSLGLLGNLIARVGSSAVPFLLPLLYQVQLGYTPLGSGLMMLPVALAGIWAKRWVSPLVGTHGYARFLVVNTVLVGGSIAGFACIGPNWPLWLALAQLGLFGAVNSMQFAAMNSVTLKDLGVTQASSGNSLFSMVQMIALGLGVSIGAGLVKAFSAHWGHVVLPFRLSFLLLGVVTMASAIVFQRMREEETEAA